MTENLAVRIIKENYNNFEVLNKKEGIFSFSYYGNVITYAIRELEGKRIAEINCLIYETDTKNYKVIKKGYKFHIPENIIKP